MQVYVGGRSRQCVECDAHVPSGEAFVAVWVGDLGGGPLASVRRVEGLLCSDRAACARRAVYRAVRGEHCREPWQAALMNAVSKVRSEAGTVVLDMYNAAADKFIAKVESGRARSVETYAELLAARLASRGASR